MPNCTLRHRCPHKQDSYEPPIYVDRNVSLNITSSQHEDYKAFGLDDIREFRSQPHKVVTELGLSEGTIESVTSYNSEYNHKNVVRQAAYQYEDHLHLEGDFHGRDREYRVVLRGEREPLKKPRDNLFLEGDFHGRPKDDYVPKIGDRTPTRKTEDNLRLVGQFERPEKPKYKGGQRPAPIVHPDNIHLEGDFDRPEKKKPLFGERPKQVRHPDNIYQDGKFEGKRKDDFQPKEGEIVAAKRPKDNLHVDGTLRSEKRDDYRLLKGKIYDNVPQEDNLKLEGEFTTKSTSQEDYKIYRDETVNVKKYEDITTKNREYSAPNLEQPHPTSSSTYVRDAKTLSVSQQRTIHETSTKITGNDDINITGQIHFQTSSHMDILDKTSESQKPLRRRTWTKIDAEKYLETRTMEDTQHSTVKNSTQHRELYSTHLTPGDRPRPVRPEDNLFPEGEFEKRPKDEFVPAERPKQKKPKDNLKPEGEFEGMPTSREEFRVTSGDRVDVVRREDNLRMEGDINTYRSRDDYIYQKTERVTSIRQEDNLRVEGEFVKRINEEFIQGERPKPIKHMDNLYPEGPKQKKPKDNLKPEGEFERTPKDKYTPGERPKPVRPEDNLFPEGEFEKRPKDEFVPAERPKQKKPEENLKPEGEFEE
ncbi:hypothetical protein RUM43_014581 [Polyplax serrata]|uniref:Uncharacterized protein n=1 Tax=Polyplax serrata TaxID=468196 RepID=A0AAN8S9I7_POLSC